MRVLAKLISLEKYLLLLHMSLVNLAWTNAERGSPHNEVSVEIDVNECYILLLLRLRLKPKHLSFSNSSDVLT